MKHHIPLILSAMTISPLFANTPIGKVSVLKGSATVLNIGHREAEVVSKGMTVFKDSSFVTDDKSFVLIVLNDNSKITIGPKSQLNIDISQDKKSTISLLKGNIRTQVEKSKNLEENKFFIKTRTAALGVRGTDFQTVYNPENKVTNLLTFDGRVAIAKQEERAPIANINEVLKDKEKIHIVTEAKFATVSQNYEKASEPVKINLEQYTKLKMITAPEVIAKTEAEVKIDPNAFKVELEKNRELYEKLAKKEASEINEIKPEVKNETAKADNKISYQPLSGGLVDLDTGIYVPPVAKKENFDEKLNLYKTTAAIGKTDETGDYVPPTGVSIDAQKGLIVAQNAPTEVKEAVNAVKEEVKKVIEVPSKPSMKDFEGQESSDNYKKYYK